MFEETQSVIPNITSYSTPDANPSPNSHPVASSNPSSHGFDGSESQSRPAFEVDNVAASPNGIISHTTDSAASCENVDGTLNATTNMATTMQSAVNSGVMTQHEVNNVIAVTKKPENMQPVQCEVCNIHCNTEEVLEKHKQGKKHLKNLQKQAIASLIAPKMPLPPVATAPIVGELENKKHKLLQNGASADALLYCEVCNVVSNSRDVFEKHLSGKKHFSKVVMQLAKKNELLNATSEYIVAAQPSTSGSQPTKAATTVQVFRCEICNISCTSNELLNLHLSGKKHQKKLKELNNIPNPPLTTPNAPLENPESSEGKVVNSQEGKPVWCELCEISCDTYDVLKNHLLGKKHQKKLEKSEKLIGPNPAPGVEPAATPIMIGPLQEEGKIGNADGNKRKAKSNEDVETKKQKVLQGGAASDAVRTCTVCNIVCNSPTVYIAHLGGQKHAAMAVKQAESGSTAPQP